MEETWLKAKERGDVRYFTGRPCKRGHIAERFTVTRHCIECAKLHGAKHFAKRYRADAEFAKTHNARAAKWKKDNPEKKRAHNKKWRDANPEKVRANNRRWYEANPDRVYENSKRWREANREKARQAFRDWEKRNPEQAVILRRASKTNRRTREAAFGKVTKADLIELFSRFNRQCARCGSFGQIEIDHIQPVARGGTNDPTNLQLLCKPCNRSKSDKDPMEWAAEHGLSLGQPFVP